jgi:hypothetical protein
MAGLELGLLKTIYDVEEGKTYINLGLEPNKVIEKSFSDDWLRIQDFDENVEALSKAAEKRIKSTVDKLKSVGVITDYYSNPTQAGFLAPPVLNKNNIQDAIGGSLPANRGYLNDYQLTAEWEQKQKNGPTEYDKDFQQWQKDYNIANEAKGILPYARKITSDLHAFDYVNTLNHPETVPQNEYYKTQTKAIANDVDAFSKVESYLSSYGSYFPGLAPSIKKELEYVTDIEQAWKTGAPNLSRAIAEGDVGKGVKALSYAGGESVKEVAAKTAEIAKSAVQAVKDDLPDLPDPTNYILIAEFAGILLAFLLLSRK